MNDVFVKKNAKIVLYYLSLQMIEQAILKPINHFLQIFSSLYRDLRNNIKLMRLWYFRFLAIPPFICMAQCLEL